MKIFKQTIGFLLILSSFLFLFSWIQNSSAFIEIQSVFATNWYSGINIPGEEKIPNQIPEINLQEKDGVKILNESVYYIIGIIKMVLYSVALVYIVVAGLRIVVAHGDETEIKSNKDSIVYGLLGFIFILLADTAVKKVFYGGGVVDGLAIEPGTCLLHPEQCATEGNRQVYALVHWGKNLLAIIAVAEIIVSGIRMITAIGEEDVIEKEKKVFVWVGVGLILLALNETVIKNVLYKIEENGGLKDNGRLDVAPDMARGVQEIAGVIQFILQFVGVFALASLIYGGLLMVANMGDDEKTTKAKEIIRDSIIGIIVAFSAYAVVATIIAK